MTDYSQTMTSPSYQQQLSAPRGETFADVARRVGSIAGTPIAPDATDAEVIDAEFSAVGALRDDAAAIAAGLHGVSETFKGSSASLTPAGNYASLDDTDLRALLAFDASGELVRSSAFVASIAAQGGLDGTAMAVRRLPRTPRLASSPNYWGVTIAGQSNASGVSATGPALTTSQPYNNKRVHGGGASFDPLVETTFESALSAACNAVSASLSDRVGGFGSLPFDLVGNNMGSPASRYTDIAKGTSVYAAGLQNVTWTKALATAASKTYAEMALSFIHGESDASAGTTRSTYAADVVQLKNDWNTDVLSATGQANRIPMFIHQKAVFNAPEGGSATTLAMLDAAEADGEVFVITPGYAFDSNDGLHYSNYSERWQGEYGAKAIWRYWVEGRNPSTVRPLSYVRLDARTILGTFFVPVPPLVWDFERVWPLDIGLGFTVTNNSGGAVLTQARPPIILPPNQVLISLAADMPGSVKVAYATTLGTAGITGGAALGRTQCARGNLRDSDNFVSFSTDASGKLYPLQNWCAAHEKDV